MIQSEKYVVKLDQGDSINTSTLINDLKRYFARSDDFIFFDKSEIYLFKITLWSLFLFA
jgi:hypothetical protein